MKRSLLLSLLDNYVPMTEEETATQKRVIDFVQAQENCFERSLEMGHITGSTWLLNKEGSHALLMHHAKLDRWFQLGGHCDGESNPLAVALKEAQEESGIIAIAPVSFEIFDIDVHTIPEHKGIKAHEHYDIRFLLQVQSDEVVIQNKESKELRWIAKNSTSEELPTKEISVIRMFNKWVEGN